MASVDWREWLAIGRAIGSGNLLRYSAKEGFTARFERAFATHLGARHVLTVRSGTGALTAALSAAGIGPGDEVIVPAYTWMSTAAAVVHVGAVPILVDIDESLTIDPAAIERAITPYTRAVMPVHMINTPCNMTAILEIARRHKLKVIEDACQAIGVRYKDGYCGALGDAGAFSFNQYKNMNIGEGGAVITSDDRLFARARNFHDLGTFVRGHDETFNEPVFIGHNMRATEIEGAMLSVQLAKLGPRMERLRRRRAAVASALATAPGIRISPHHDPDNAVTLSVMFDTPEEATRFASEGGAYCLHDNSKHVYTNWEPILSKRTAHPEMNPWRWAHREIDYPLDMCARTLDILKRTCRIELGGRAPVALLRRRVMARVERHAAGHLPSTVPHTGQAVPRPQPSPQGEPVQQDLPFVAKV
jgi:dTDP-4-amino-4,6-dideoxygalactose transaminase